MGDNGVVLFFFWISATSLSLSDTRVFLKPSDRHQVKAKPVIVTCNGRACAQGETAPETDDCGVRLPRARRAASRTFNSGILLFFSKTLSRHVRVSFSYLRPVYTVTASSCSVARGTHCWNTTCRPRPTTRIKNDDFAAVETVVIVRRGLFTPSRHTLGPGRRPIETSRRDDGDES